MPRDILLALGLALTPATQLRMGGLPLGAGELLLSAWLMLALVAQIAAGTAVTHRAFRLVLAFWAVLWFALAVGLVCGLALDLFQDLPAMRHDIVAYLLMMSLGLMLALEFGSAARRRRIFALLCGVGTAILLAQLASGVGLRLIPGTETWYYDRFQGWSENPNQIGFFTAVLTFTALHVVQTAPSNMGKFGALLCAAIAIIGGILTGSDSFMVALLIGTAAWVVVTARAWLLTMRSGVMLRGAAVVFALLAAPLAAASFAPFAAATLERIEQRTESVYADNDQGETRLELWAEAMQRGVHSGFLGFGPGPQLTSKSYKRPPPSKFEAHNTLLDLFTQGGLLAVGAFIWLGATALRTAWRAQLAGLVALLGALASFSMFHLVLRQPVFWFVIVLTLLAAARLPAVAARAVHRDSVGALP